MPRSTPIVADRSEAVASQLLEGVEHLRAGRLDLAATQLRAVCSDPDLGSAEDLVDIRARALSLLADAELRLGRIDAADAAVREALDLLRALDDTSGVQAVRELWAQVQKARQDAAADARRSAAAERLRELTLEEIESSYGSEPLRLADVLVKRAHAAADVGDHATGMAAANRALELACTSADARIEVFAFLALARVDTDASAEHLRTAHRRADRQNEFNLVSTIASAAEALGVELPAQVGPDLGRADDDLDDVMS